MISKTHAQATLNAEFGNVAYAIPDTYYVGLSSTAIVEDDGSGFTEPDNTGYARAVIANKPENWTVDAEGNITNAIPIEFPSFTVTDPNIFLTHWFIASVETEGAALYYNVIVDNVGNPLSLPIISGGRVLFSAGNLKLRRINA